MGFGKLTVAICVFFLYAISGVKAEEPYILEAITGTVSIQINPLKNELIVLDDYGPFRKYPIALGKPETPTPVGDFIVVNKYKNWGSGFGTRWIGLNVPWGNYGIHGTNRPYSIGHDASHGCIRMLNRHVEEIYELVKVGTKVSILGHVLREPQLDPRSLAKGDSGRDVQLIQSRLRSGGFYNGVCNGRFDSLTEHAMKAFEKTNALPIDVIVITKLFQSIPISPYTPFTF